MNNKTIKTDFIKLLKYLILNNFINFLLKCQRYRYETFTQTGRLFTKLNFVGLNLKQMNILILTLIFSSTLLARSVVPDRIITQPLDLYSSRNKTLKNGNQLVRVTKIDKNGDFSASSGTIILTKEKYQNYLNSANAVFEMIPSQFGSNEEKMSRRGTAFSIGNNLVLTNLHVLDTNFENTTDCDDFEIKNYQDEKFQCKKVHYCSAEQDVCLIEMKIKTITKRDCLFCPAVKNQVSLADGPSLKLFSQLLEGSSWDHLSTTAIGNSAGLGIHFSQGRGLFLRKGQFRFYAPITTGNSGGPLLNETGQVIGIIKKQTTITFNTDPNKSYNIATPVGDFVKAVRLNLENYPEVLDKFNSSVVE